MKITTEPRSDQWNFDDFGGTTKRVFTVAGVRAGTAEQKYDILLAGEERVWRPPLTVLRLLKEAWTDETDVWVGRKVMLYGDPSITFGRDKVGGIRLSHLSHIEKTITLPLTVTRGKRSSFSVDPLTDAMIVEALKAEWKVADPERRAAIEAEVAAINGTPAKPAADPGEVQTPEPEPAA